MSFSESLTVRILGDSSQLQRELDTVLQRFENLKSRISEASNLSRQFSSSLSRLSQVSGPLQQVGNLLSRIAQQLQLISQRPVTVNVNSALQSLNQLTAAAQQAAASIQAISAMSAIGTVPGGTITNPTSGGAPRLLASGGLVTGAPGIDRVPARLTAGEFVMSRSATERLGLGFLERLNSGDQAGLAESDRKTHSIRSGGIFSVSEPVRQGAQQLSSLQLPERTHTSSAVTTGGSAAGSRVNSSTHYDQSTRVQNRFGGVSIHVSTPGDVESLIRDFERRDVSRRIRQG